MLAGPFSGMANWDSPSSNVLLFVTDFLRPNRCFNLFILSCMTQRWHASWYICAAQSYAGLGGVAMVHWKLYITYIIVLVSNGLCRLLECARCSHDMVYMTPLGVHLESMSRYTLHTSLSTIVLMCTYPHTTLYIHPHMYIPMSIYNNAQYIIGVSTMHTLPLYPCVNLIHQAE